MPKHPGHPTDFESFLTWEALTEVLSYDPGTGEFRWVKAKQLGGWKGRLAGAVDERSGYRRIKILGRSFYASRLAWFYMTRRWPVALIDHKNGNPGDDRWDNLREATRAENGRNRRVSANNRSGISGVYWHSGNNGWAAQIRVDGKKTYLGTFATIEEATAARKGAEAARYGEFDREASALSTPGPLAPSPLYVAAEKAKKEPKRGVTNDTESFLTQEVIIAILSYNPADGEFIWRSNETNPRRIKVGSRADSASPSGYRNIDVLNRKFRAHRVAWLYMTGRWPKTGAVIDHINGVKDDNRWANLREVTRGQNAHNVPKKKTNTSGYTGVYYRPENGKWRAIIRFEGVVRNLGTFATAEEAAAAREKFANEFLSGFNRSA